MFCSLPPPFLPSSSSFFFSFLHPPPTPHHATHQDTEHLHPGLVSHCCWIFQYSSAYLAAPMTRLDERGRVWDSHGELWNGYYTQSYISEEPASRWACTWISDLPPLLLWTGRKSYSTHWIPDFILGYFVSLKSLKTDLLYILYFTKYFIPGSWSSFLTLKLEVIWSMAWIKVIKLKHMHFQLMLINEASIFQIHTIQIHKTLTPWWWRLPCRTPSYPLGAIPVPCSTTLWYNFGGSEDWTSDPSVTGWPLWPLSSATPHNST